MQAAKLTENVRELGAELARVRAGFAASKKEAASEVAGLQDKVQALAREGTALKAALETSAASLEAASAERERLDGQLRSTTSELDTVRQRGLHRCMLPLSVRLMHVAVQCAMCMS